MPEHLLVVFSNTAPEIEHEFNEWYSKVHIVDVVDNVDGVVTGQRFELASHYRGEDPRYKYMAIYTIKEAALEDVRAQFLAYRVEREEALAEGRTPVLRMMDGAFDGEPAAYFFTSLTPQYSVTEKRN